ncbi:MAG TPA: hypothetical protein VFV23_01400 [Verrucomicrobiae bacterium]|nr:hypothetical protein [Verrucomicrobiae bacterium]
MPRWTSCNILHAAPDANRVWQFQARGDFKLSREIRAAIGQALPGKYVGKSWNTLWQPSMNVAWLPPEHVFLRVIELPKSNWEETVAMVELQLEKLSPLPVTQIVWTIHPLQTASVENLQTAVVVIAERKMVEEFLGKLEASGFLADRLEAPMLDQLESAHTTEDGAWIYPVAFSGQNAALVAFWSGRALRNLSFIIMPPAGDRAASLKHQLTQLMWSGELEGWLASQPKWRLVADPVNAAEWQTVLREGLGEEIEIEPPLSPMELAHRTARRATQASANNSAALLPAEFSERYRQQFHDRLWWNGLVTTGIVYAVCVVIYFCATFLLGMKTTGVERQVTGIAGSYTNAMQLQAQYDVLKERQNLKFAALDCWKLVAENLPPGLSLQRMSFQNGETLVLNGQVSPDDLEQVESFNENLRKAQLNGQPMFDTSAANDFNFRQAGNTVTWTFSVHLLHVEQPEKRR